MFRVQGEGHGRVGNSDNALLPSSKGPFSKLQFRQ